MNANNKLEIDNSTARVVLEKLEVEIEEKRQAFDGLANEIDRLEKAYKSLREQLNGGAPDSGRAQKGDNKSKIKDYMAKFHAGKFVSASQIAKGTSIGNSSVAYTLNAFKDEFERDSETKRWKLKP